MSMLDPVDPSARGMAMDFPLHDPRRQTLDEHRRRLLALFAHFAPAEPIPLEERMVPGPLGAPDLRVVLHRPASGKSTGAAIVYVHGGGFIAGSPDMLASVLRRLCDEHGVLLAAVACRLAPESPFPGPVEDCYARLGWLAANAGALGMDPGRIIIMGESADGGLAAAMALLARDRDGPALKAQVLIYPMLDPHTGTPDAPVDNSMTGTFVWTRATNRVGWDAMGGDGDIVPERLGHFAPMLAADVAGLPRTFLAVGALDHLLEEGVAYVLRLARAGVPVEARVYAGGIHGFDG